MKEETFPHTRKPLRGRRRRVAERESFSTKEESTATGVRRESGEIPAQRIRADRHSPGREACLLTRRSGRGLELRLGLRSERRERTGVGGLNTA